MKNRAIILSLFLLLPLVPIMAQEQDDFEAIPMTYQKKKPCFNGGDFSKWVNEHKIYPEEAKKAGIEGRVTTQFTITKEGKLINVRILRGVHPLLDEEAIRVIESAPQIWKPGEKKGKPVDVTCAFPVIFKLTDEERAQVDSGQFMAFDYGVKEKKPWLFRVCQVDQRASGLPGGSEKSRIGRTGLYVSNNRREREAGKSCCV